MGGSVGVRSAVRGGGRESRLQVAKTPAAARALESESAAAISVIEVVDVGDGSRKGRRQHGQQRRIC